MAAQSGFPDPTPDYQPKPAVGSPVEPTKRTPLPTPKLSKKEKLVYIFSLFLATGLTLIVLWQISHLHRVHYQLNHIERSLAEKQRENDRLRGELRLFMDPIWIAQQAAAQGLQKQRKSNLEEDPAWHHRQGGARGEG